MKHKTTRQHFKKYEKMCKERGLAISNLSLFVYSGTVEELALHHEFDPALNNIPLRKFDRLWYMYKSLGRAGGMSQAEYVYCLKHLLIYQVLNCEPEFEDDDER